MKYVEALENNAVQLRNGYFVHSLCYLIISSALTQDDPRTLFNASTKLGDYLRRKPQRGFGY